MIDLREHNKKAYLQIIDMFAKGKNRVAISHATGTGKSYIISQLCEDFNNEKKLVLVPNKYITE